MTLNVKAIRKALFELKTPYTYKKPTLFVNTSYQKWFDEQSTSWREGIEVITVGEIPNDKR